MTRQTLTASLSDGVEVPTAAPAANGTLTITTDPSPLAVLVSDHQWNVVGQGASPLKLTLAAGLYAVRATQAGHPDLTTIARVVSKADRPVHLSIADPHVTRVATAFVLDLLDKYVHKVEPVSSSCLKDATEEPALDAKRFWIRFLRLKDWQTAERVEPKVFSTEYVRGRAILNLTNTHSSVVFAQIAGPSGPALNVALPPAGARPVKSQLVVSATADSLTAHVRLATDWANAALQYMAQGYIDQAREIVKASRERSEEKPSVFARAIRHIVNRFDDPSAMLIPRYLGLRTGEDTILSTVGDALLDVFQPGIADGYVISAEIAARQRHHDQSADRIIQIQPGNLPLFTEGFSLVIHRIRELIDLDQTTEVLDRPSEGKVKKLKELTRTLNRWAPYLDLNRPTVTFKGNDVTAPSGTDQTPTPTTAEGWVQGPEPPAASAKLPR